MSSNLPPDEERNHGFHTDIYYPGLIKSVWRRGPVRLIRERKYLDRTNSQMISEAWILSIVGRDQRIGIKHERDAND